MYTDLFFENSLLQLRSELRQAAYSIFLFFDQVNDNEIFDILQDKASHKVVVELIVGKGINKLQSTHYERLSKLGGKIWIPTIVKSPTEQPASNLVDVLNQNRFGVIDNKNLILESPNSEEPQRGNTLTVIRDNAGLAGDYLRQFHFFKRQFYSFESLNTLTTDQPELIFLRLSNLKNAIVLGDKQDILFQRDRLLAFKSYYTEIDEIESAIESERYSEVIYAIERFFRIYKNKQPALYSDFEVGALTLEIKTLEWQISSLEDEKTEIEKILFEFELRHNREVGVLIVELLELRRQRLERIAKNNPAKKNDFERAEKDYNDFNQNYESFIEIQTAEIKQDQRQILKQKYRLASKLCHPDMVAPEFRTTAAEIFLRLKKAYDQNDLATIEQISAQLNQGIFGNIADGITEKEKLSAIVKFLRFKRTELEAEVSRLKQMQAYSTIAKIANWDLYFVALREQLEFELRIARN